MLDRAVPMIDIWRGPFLECTHMGHAAIWGPGGLEAAWGDPETEILPRSSCKIVQALPMVESGAAANLSQERLALATASHSGAPQHVREVGAWLADLGLSEPALRCGPQASRDRGYRHQMIRDGAAPDRVHNQCSGKHTGFLTLSQHLGGGAEYHDIDHPVQRAIRATFEDLTGYATPGHAIDGCSAPNFATTVAGLARAMAAFATRGVGVRGAATRRLLEAMLAHPHMVAGEGDATTELMRAAAGAAAVKSGAEGVFVAILPASGLGVALKIADGAKRAAEAAITALLSHTGALAAEHPVAQRYLAAPIRNWDGLVTGEIRAAAGFPA